MANSISDLATLIRRSLDQFKGVTLIPFGWVAGFIVLYILLIGPGDYFFLKKVLKRMELTWITFPTIVVTVSLLAYYAAYIVKGTDLRVNKIDVVDIDLESNAARGTSWINLFSPQNRDYSVAVVPVSPDRDLRPKVTAPPLPGTDVLLTWFGAPEGGLRGMNTRGQGMGFGGGGYSYAPINKAEELEDVRVGIWSTKGFVARWFGPAPASRRDRRRRPPDRRAPTGSPARSPTACRWRSEGHDRRRSAGRFITALARSSRARPSRSATPATARSRGRSPATSRTTGRTSRRSTIT